MSVQSAIIQNIIDRVQAVTPTTLAGMPNRFLHVDDVIDPEALTPERGCSRRFIVLCSGPRDVLTGDIGHDSDETHRYTTFEMYIAYEMQKSVKLATAAICEDADLIVRELMRTDNDRYNAAQTQMSLRHASVGNVSYTENYALVPYEIKCRYRV